MGDDSKVRLDKWLWAARFFKTRGLAKTAIEGGKVQCRGDRCKPSKEPKVGDELQIRQGFEQRTVVIRELSGQRRGAAEAQLLYEETADSVLQREEAAAKRKAMGPGLLISEHRPSKKQRRQIHRFRNARNSPEQD
ncbi:RNA-binding S4 domain-containing protein [Halopseudomonas sp.]|uniref:RNA-binding S4 domain-containing protein n=1 Tax=Halopseudomonas sp. TaxID=2901191 RepID=UPI0035690D60